MWISLNQLNSQDKTRAAYDARGEVKSGDILRVANLPNSRNYFIYFLVFLTEKHNKEEEIGRGTKTKQSAVGELSTSTSTESSYNLNFVLSTAPVARSKSRGSEGVAPGLSEATAETSVPAGLRPLVPTLPRRILSPLPTHTGGQGPAPVPRQHRRSLRMRLHPSALWWGGENKLLKIIHYTISNAKRIFVILVIHSNAPT